MTLGPRKALLITPNPVPNCIVTTGLCLHFNFHGSRPTHWHPCVCAMPNLVPASMEETACLGRWTERWLERWESTAVTCPAGRPSGCLSCSLGNCSLGDLGLCGVPRVGGRSPLPCCESFRSDGNYQSRKLWEGNSEEALRASGLRLVCLG